MEIAKSMASKASGDNAFYGIAVNQLESLKNIMLQGSTNPGSSCSSDEDAIRNSMQVRTKGRQKTGS